MTKKQGKRKKERKRAQAGRLLRALSCFLLPLTCCWFTGCNSKAFTLVKDGSEAHAKRQEEARKDEEARKLAEDRKKREQADTRSEEASSSESNFLSGLKPPWEWGIFLPKVPPGPADSLVLRGDRLEPGKQAAESKAVAELAGAHELYRRGEYSKAERLFHRIAENTKNPVPLAEEARFYEAECLRQQGRYPKAADTYDKMLIDFPSGADRELAVQHMFDIANYWLDDTREEMRLTREKQEGKRWFVWPNFIHWNKSKPFLDEEGRAMEKLEQVRYNDMTGPLADKALFLAGSVKFFNEDYKEADHYFSQLVEFHRESPFAEQAIELGIISKHLSTGGADYDGRKVAEARQLVDTALRNYPNLAAKKEDFLNRQLVGITLQQAEKDYKIAEFYRRTGHPGSAWFYYEIVRRRYPGVQPYYDLATHRMHELKTKLEKSQGKAPSGEMLVPGTPLTGTEKTPQPRPVPTQPEIAPPPRTLPPDFQR